MLQQSIINPSVPHCFDGQNCTSSCIPFKGGWEISLPSVRQTFLVGLFHSYRISSLSSDKPSTGFLYLVFYHDHMLPVVPTSQWEDFCCSRDNTSSYSHTQDTKHILYLMWPSSILQIHLKNFVSGQVTSDWQLHFFLSLLIRSQLLKERFYCIPHPLQLPFQLTQRSWISVFFLVLEIVAYMHDCQVNKNWNIASYKINC